MKYILSLLCCLNLLFASCQVNQYGKGVQEDTKRIFTTNKDYMYRLSLEGVVEKKELCNTCDINKFRIHLRLNQISEKPDISKIQYPPYYMFSGDSILIISVTKNLFDNVNEKDKIIKEMNDLDISVNELKIFYLSKEKNKWLP